MATENNEGKGPIEDQVRKILSGLGGEAGEFLSKEKPGLVTGSGKEIQGPVNLGILQGVVLQYTCGPDCRGTHAVILPFEAFKLLFNEGDDPIYFDNFKFSEWSDKDKGELASLLARCEANETASEKTQELLTKVQALADQVQIKNSHLKVENDCLRRELDQYKARGVEKTQTALDFEPPNPKRNWTFLNSFKGFRLIGREVK